MVGSGLAASIIPTTSKEKKSLNQKDNLLDRAGNLELAANDFQMELAADVITKTSVKGEAAAIAMNKQVAQDVRQTMKVRGATMPENLPIEPPIAEVKKRLKKQTAAAIIPAGKTEYEHGYEQGRAVAGGK
jgi:hypothetical protein